MVMWFLWNKLTKMMVGSILFYKALYLQCHGDFHIGDCYRMQVTLILAHYRVKWYCSWLQYYKQQTMIQVLEFITDD